MVLCPSGDAARRAVVTCPPGAAAVVVRGGSLRAVDVEGSPALRRLDLTDCAPGVHLGLHDAPALTEVEVPHEGDGATLTLNFADAAPRLEVSGRVHTVDAAWLDPPKVDGDRPTQASFDVIRAAGRDDARLEGLSLQTAPFAASEADLVVAICADDAERAAAMATHDDRAQRLFLVSRGCSSHLRWWDGGRDMSRAVHAAVLGVLTSPPPSTAPSLPPVVARPAARPIVLQMVADPGIGRRGEPAGDRLRVRLLVLQWLLDRGHAPSEIWAARALLCPGVLQAWTWGVEDPDVCYADLRLWATCRSAVPEADRYRALLAAGAGPAQLSALSRFAVEEPASGVALLLDALRFGAEHMRPPSRPVRARKLVEVLQSLIELRAHPDCPEAVALLCEWAARHLSPPEAVHLLGALRRLGSDAALRVLAREVHDRKGIDPGLRRVALRYMVVPPTHDHLAFEIDRSA